MATLESLLASPERCDCCSAKLECGRIGKCDDCGAQNPHDMFPAPGSNALSERRKADRHVMADAIQELAEVCGALVDREESGVEIALEIEAPGGLCLRVDFDGKSIQPDTHVLPWCMSLDSKLTLHPSFGQVNPHHFRKSTVVKEGFEALYLEVKRGLIAAANKTAYTG